MKKIFYKYFLITLIFFTGCAPQVVIHSDDLRSRKIFNIDGLEIQDLRPSEERNVGIPLEISGNKYVIISGSLCPDSVDFRRLGGKVSALFDSLSITNKPTELSILHYKVGVLSDETTINLQNSAVGSRARMSRNLNILSYVLVVGGCLINAYIYEEEPTDAADPLEKAFADCLAPFKMIFGLGPGTVFLAGGALLQSGLAMSEQRALEGYLELELKIGERKTTISGKHISGVTLFRPKNPRSKFGTFDDYFVEDTRKKFVGTKKELLREILIPAEDSLLTTLKYKLTGEKNIEQK